jgi:hypothetical protein
MKSSDRGLPQHAHAAGRRVIQQNAMQMRTPNSVSRSARKLSLGFCTVAHETNAAEWICFAVGKRDAETAQSFDSLWHQALATSLVDRRNGTIRHDHAQTAMARRDGRRQAGWTAASYEYIHRVGKVAHKKVLRQLLTR